MDNYLYHNVYGLKNLNSIIECGFIKVNKKYITPSICLTRNKRYLSERGIKIVLDYNKLRYNYKIKPFCIYGWYEVNKYTFKVSKKDEFEERCYSNININKCCISIEIDSKVYKGYKLPEHPLIKIVNN